MRNGVFPVKVSIHAPARGATKFGGARVEPYTVSIHAPARGATGQIVAMMKDHSSFNPRSRTGSDFPINFWRRRRESFQSTLPHGERPEWPGWNLYGHDVSIHAPARGATRLKNHAGTTQYCFNPRSRTGSDHPTCRSFSGGFSFQSTLPHGERPAIPHRRNGKRRFQSTLPHGERPVCEALRGIGLTVSIHAPARGATTDS